MKQQRFKVTLRNDTVSFNHFIYCDILTIDLETVLHVVEGSTTFQAATRLKNMAANELWETLKTCWMNVYFGPADTITDDTGSNLVARAFQNKAYMLHINCTEVPVEAANDIPLLVRYHTPLRRAFSIISE